MIKNGLENKEFLITIEVVPPAGSDSSTLLEKLSDLDRNAFHGFSVASNPVATPRMSAMVFCHEIEQKIQKKAILHCTIRDHNKLALSGELWGAAALGIDTVIAMTGDPAKETGEHVAGFVGDINACELISLARKCGMYTGAVFDFRPEVNGFDFELTRMEKKVAAGCQFVVTQPVYDEATAQKIARAMEPFNIPVIMGILPLLSYRHARFLNDKVDGISVPDDLQAEMEVSKNPVDYGIYQARQMLDQARSLFSGACIMPPFDRFDILKKIL